MRRKSSPPGAPIGWDFSERARQLESSAAQLAERFEDAFWCEDIGTYALALDGDKQPCRVATSNAGQVLISGIARADRAATGGASAHGAEILFGLGRADRGGGRAALQSDVVPQRIDLAP